LKESVALAKALGFKKEETEILNAINKAKVSKKNEKIALDESAKNIVKRYFIVSQLSEIDPDYKEAFDLLQNYPHRAVKNEVVRELVRKSGLVSVQSIDQKLISSSHDIPAALLSEDNLIAMEDLMLRMGSGSKAFLIIKDGVQCVVPREKSYDVLTGKCAYTVLDENGIRHFEPLHVMNALRLNTPTKHQLFTIYASDAVLAEISELGHSSCSNLQDDTTETELIENKVEIVEEMKEVSDKITDLLCKRLSAQDEQSVNGKKVEPKYLFC
jgi:hypothetical protein